MSGLKLTLPACRTDTDVFLRDSGYFRKGARWPHHPILAFVRTDDGVEVQVLDSAAQVRRSALPDATQCLQQWRGEWSSDFFTFTLGDARAALGAER